MRPVLFVVVTGGECTGKTTLAAALAARQGTVWVPEAARLHAEAKEEPLDASDVEVIARLHVASADRAAAEAERRGARLAILDTDLVSTVVYARHYYGSSPAWVERAAEERLGDLYLLHHPDVPWLPDPSRDRPHARAEIHALFEAVLAEMGATRVVSVAGGWEERRESAERAVDDLLRAAR